MTEAQHTVTVHTGEGPNRTTRATMGSGAVRLLGGPPRGAQGFTLKGYARLRAPRFPSQRCYRTKFTIPFLIRIPHVFLWFVFAPPAPPLRCFVWFPNNLWVGHNRHFMVDSDRVNHEGYCWPAQILGKNLKHPTNCPPAISIRGAGFEM